LAPLPVPRPSGFFMSSRKLQDWLEYIERQHPKAIEMGLARVARVRKAMDSGFSGRIITVGGTNGKGSTCAMLEAMLLAAGYRVGLYQKPELVHFEERCRIRGESATEQALVPHFERVEAARQDVTLTYFEFTTLAIFSLMAQASLDVMILEVGLGGRLDAVNIIDADCAIITSIALDHTELLGKDRETIGMEKAAIMRPGRPVIVSDPVPPQSVVDHAQAVGADLWRMGRDFNFSGDKLQWNWAGRGKRYSGLAYPALRGANQLMNASGVLAALESLRERLPVTAQAVRNGLAMVELPGRFQIVPGQPTLVLDVAHNPHAVAALTENLDAMGFFPTTHAVLGAMANKDLNAMLARIGPLADRWYFTDLASPRAELAANLLARWKVQETRKDVSASAWPTPSQALAAAIAAADPADRIVVFGSFYTVGEVLAKGLPRLDAPHV